jgi:hypothetical protein
MTSCRQTRSGRGETRLANLLGPVLPASVCRRARPASGSPSSRTSSNTPAPSTDIDHPLTRPGKAVPRPNQANLACTTEAGKALQPLTGLQTEPLKQRKTCV